MRFKVRRGEGLGICVSCRNGMVMEDDRGDRLTWCNNLMRPLLVQRPVVQCTDYEERTRESEHEMRKIAWELKTDKRGKLGFAPPSVKKDDY